VRTTRRFGGLLAAALAATTTLVAQQVFRSGTDVVLLNVTVLDENGRLVGGLEREEFKVFEDGVAQTITNFSREPRPIALSLVIDSSTSMEERMSTAQQAAIGFVKRIGARDIAQVIDFDSSAIELQPFTSDHDALERAIKRTAAGGSTSLYNAVYIALSALRDVRPETQADIRRQAIVLLSDGEDTSSLKTADDIIDFAKRSEVIIYPIALRSRTDTPTRGWNQAEFVLRSLAQETGGKLYPVNDVAQLEGIYQQIAEELANQYTLGYSSTNNRTNGAWRRIIVQTTRTSTAVRTKSGYYGPKAPR
jgi:Ca-activated chloride channel family protein